ncbi:glycoside hydrolase family 2 TIM barrel-domain containing protein [Pontiella sulfatireligans]|uniref:Beta-galactosidase BoGH2A n=1 Tax=Pontiella sulfatireligans TaxID=2750658 RepID=A0A6C2UMB0_9BACT|nr:glycoside hydrolase family 2 TIM barrel-domain containing protein [Pontiella sulfatireligans]VGO20444.1 Beta-galactosidase BoGH2A [Pontiella sulfatireligans]
MKIITLLMLLGMAQASHAERERMNFDFGWKFKLGDVTGQEAPALNDAEWRVLNLPHDWSIEGEYSESNPMGDTCGYLPAGIGWYRKTIAVDPAWKGKHVEIAFDGAFMNSTVWANGKKLGDRPYGWISFAYDISDLVADADAITFAVRLDNDKQPSARWYTGSGIYAHTWLDVMDKVHVVRDGIFVRTKGDTVEIDTEVENRTSDAQKAELRISIKDASGMVVAEAKSPLAVKKGETKTVNQTIELSNPSRWSVESPVLYTAVSEVLVGGESVDRIETRFGVRDIEWNPKTGMWLNGKNVKLQGVCNHQDAGALGAAVPDKVLRFRIEQLKAMGCNAIRTAHNPQTPIFYDLCDELGMLVMDEIFDGWLRKAFEDYGAHHFDEWWERDVTDWIRRDRNHPSIVIYSLGNETHGDVAPELVTKCHELDPTRPVTSGHSNTEDMDVIGVNGHSEKMGWFEEVDGQVFIGTENTHTWQVRGFYRTKTWFRDGYPSTKQKPYPCPDLTDEEIFTYDWIIDADRSNRKQIFNSSYDNAMVRLTSRLNIEQLRDYPNYAGSFRWTGYDYIGEAGYVHGGWPFKSFMGGAIDMANFEKDLFYLYQSQWADKPMVHILPHWTHPSMKKGTLVPVQVYSSCDAVELFFNGTSLGKQEPGADWDKMQCQWMVPWKPGGLKAVGFVNGQATVEQTIATAGAPAQLALSVDGEPLTAEGQDMVQVRVTTQDDQGEFYPYGENRTWFHVIGPGKIRALDNGSPVDVEKHFEADNRVAFYGLTRAYIESTGDQGDIALLASCILGEKKLVYSDLVSIDAKRLALRGQLPKASIEIFYSVDGSTPTQQSTLYTKAFPVKPGTTVKALIVLNGKPVQQLEERFAVNEGFIWEGGGQSSNVPSGEQAETATFEGADLVTKGEYFRGKGFLRFGKAPGAYIEWYQENDGGAGEADLSIRYGGRIKSEKGYKVNVTVNGSIAHEGLLLPNTRSPGREWAKITVPIQVGRGANTIRITPHKGSGLCIDEILIR